MRFGNVLGSRGSVVPLFKRQIERGGPVTITHPDMKRFFMTIPEAVHLVLQAAAWRSGGELFVLNMGEPVRIVDLAEDLIRLSGRRCRQTSPIVFTGLRPGEKLEEQLWEPGSLVEAAGDDEVFRVVEPIQAGDGPAGGLDAAIARLEDAAARGDALAIHELLSECLPTFVSSWHQGLPRRACGAAAAVTAAGGVPRFRANVAATLAGRLGAMAVALVFATLLSRWIGLARYGTWSVYAAFLGFSSVLDFGLSSPSSAPSRTRRRPAISAGCPPSCTAAARSRCSSAPSSSPSRSRRCWRSRRRRGRRSAIRPRRGRPRWSCRSPSC